MLFSSGKILIHSKDLFHRCSLCEQKYEKKLSKLILIISNVVCVEVPKFSISILLKKIEIYFA